MNAPAVEPLTGRRFVVDLGDGVSTGFTRVVIPMLPAAPAPETQPLLVLTRGATGATDLYKWWDAARSGGGDPARVISVAVFTAEGRPTALRWRFVGARPHALSFSPLDALDAGIVYETLTLTFERMEMGDAKPPPPA